MLFSMQLLVEMSSGAFRALEARVDAFVNGSLNKTELWKSEFDASLNATLSRNELAAQNRALTLSAEHDVVLTLPTVYHDVFCIDLDR